MLWPDTTCRTDAGVVSIGGVTVTDLAASFGTPLYIYDEETLRSQARRFLGAFRGAYPQSRVVYAAKAYLSPAIVALLHTEGIGLDVVSGGELYAGLWSGVDADQITFHGNNKSLPELREAVAAGVGAIALDHIGEIDMVARVAREFGVTVSCLLRLNPGIDVHTHAKIRTGHLDSKFGFPITTGDAAAAVATIVRTPEIHLAGYHAHIGSQLFDAEAYRLTIQTMFAFAAEMRDVHGIVPEVLCPGGGFGIAYGDDGDEAPIEAWATIIAEAVREGCAKHDLPEPELVVEPGRSMVGRAGVALYEVGAIKPIAGVRTYVSVDGGMADNIRPTLYGAKYAVELANRLASGPLQCVTVAGKYCESGDILVEEAMLPEVRPGDLLAMPATGAYCLAMASNYNLATRPAVVLVSDGHAQLIRRRETYEDLMAAEIVIPHRSERMAHVS